MKHVRDEHSKQVTIGQAAVREIISLKVPTSQSIEMHLHRHGFGQNYTPERYTTQVLFRFEAGIELSSRKI